MIGHLRERRRLWVNDWCLRDLGPSEEEIASLNPFEAFATVRDTIVTIRGGIWAQLKDKSTTLRRLSPLDE